MCRIPCGEPRGPWQERRGGRSRVARFLLLVGVAAALSGCLTRVGDPPLPYVRVAHDVPAVDPARIRMASRLEEIEGELQRLRESIERVQRSGGNEAAVKDLQERVAAIERKLGMELSSGAGREAPARQTPMPMPSAPEHMGRAQEGPAQVVPPAGPVPQRVEVRNEPLPSDEKAYRDAYLQVRRSSFSEAIPLLEAFLRDHPRSSYAADATYWLGEALLAQGRADEAVLQFDRVIKEYPGSKKELSALLRQGESFTKMGDTQSARIIFEKLVKEHPHSPQARAAQGKLKALPHP